MLDELERQKVAENTVVLFMTDNGRPFPRCKTTVYDSGVKTPLIVRWPAKIKPGTTTACLVSSIDIGVDDPRASRREAGRVDAGPEFCGRVRRSSRQDA